MSATGHPSWRSLSELDIWVDQVDQVDILYRDMDWNFVYLKIGKHVREGPVPAIQGPWLNPNMRQMER